MSMDAQLISQQMLQNTRTIKINKHNKIIIIILQSIVAIELQK